MGEREGRRGKCGRRKRKGKSEEDVGEVEREGVRT